MLVFTQPPSHVKILRYAGGVLRAPSRHFADKVKVFSPPFLDREFQMTFDRYRAFVISTTSSGSRRHQFRSEKISTSRYPL